MAESRLKTVEYAQFKFDHHFWSNLSQIWPKCFQTGRILSESEGKKPAMGRILTKSDEIWPNSVEIQPRAFDHYLTNFGQFGEKRNHCVLWRTQEDIFESAAFFQSRCWKVSINELNHVVRNTVFFTEIRLKRSNACGLISATDFGRTNAKTDRKISKLAEFRISTKLDDIRPTSVVEIQLRAFERF
jgi:hypothetical protein